MHTKKKHSAIALFSGGLDSTLAILAMLRQGIKVTGVVFLTHFGCEAGDRSSCSKNPFSASKKFGFDVKLCHLADKFIEIVKNPKYGHGRNMNPCIDCRILMLKEAKEFMAITKADFIITGEVVGQRPMSQMRNTLYMIDQAAGLKGLVLRPLSAKLLEPTMPETNGIVDREKLYNFSGRSRKKQMALAQEFGLTEYPMPAGGCLLTEPNYSNRLRELLSHNSNPSLNDFHLLRVGRHFRLSPLCKLVVGRNEQDNLRLEEFAGENDYLMYVEGFGSPLALLKGYGCEELLDIAASICARYSDAKNLPEAEVKISNKNESFIKKVKPAENSAINSYKIELRKYGIKN